MILRKKKFPRKKYWEIIFDFFFHYFFLFLEPSEMHFDLDESKIGAKFDNLVIYCDILINFIRILNTKSTISQKLKIA